MLFKHAPPSQLKHPKSINTQGLQYKHLMNTTLTSTTTGLYGSQTSNKGPAKADFVKIISSKWTLFIPSLIWIMSMAIFAETVNETADDGGSGGIILGISIVILLVGIGLSWYITEFLASYSVKWAKQVSQYEFPVPWLGMCLTCVCMNIATGYFAGLFVGDLQNKYCKIIDGKPLLIGQRVWIFPFGLSRVVVIKKEQNISLEKVKARTSDGVGIISNVSFEGQLANNPNRWFDFEAKKSEFIQRLETAYILAISSMKLEELNKPLVISFETIKESTHIFDDSVIFPREGGVIQVTGFKVLTKQTVY